MSPPPYSIHPVNATEKINLLNSVKLNLLQKNVFDLLLFGLNSSSCHANSDFTDTLWYYRHTLILQTHFDITDTLWYYTHTLILHTHFDILILHTHFDILILHTHFDITDMNSVRSII